MPLNKYAGQTGVVLESKRVGKVTSRTSITIDIIIQLDKTGEKIVAKNDEGLGFHSELESAKRLIGRSVWAKSQYNTLTPTMDPCKNLAEDQRLPISKHQKVTVTRVDFGDYEQPVILFGKTENGREGQIYTFQKHTYLDDKFHGLEKYSFPRYYSEFFLFNDPRKMYPTWSNAIWKLVEDGEVAIGMTADMVKLACEDDMVNGKLKEKGFVLSLRMETR